MDRSSEYMLNSVGLLFGLMVTILLIYTIYTDRKEKPRQHINVLIIIQYAALQIILLQFDLYFPGRNTPKYYESEEHLQNTWYLI